MTEYSEWEKIEKGMIEDSEQAVKTYTSALKDYFDKFDVLNKKNRMNNQENWTYWNSEDSNWKKEAEMELNNLARTLKLSESKKGEILASCQREFSTMG